MDKSSALTAFGALSQSTRLDVIRLLIIAGAEGLSAGDLAGKLDVRQNTLSANLTVLLNAGLVSNRREGRSIRYFADMSQLRALLTFLLEDCCGGNPALCQPALDTLACC
ncbi:ArsR/SmtB family transcription factor [Flavimaricola marinus]|uniref:Biofilm growth-associated repressor n=1 Tax=Flavimaricola marinus TaxID=1819565 RepID=A0A238LFY9_9RHOB|nr:metalloregulator ArsR/SmtB family transcription factor [Flavimaricola marinus]SMY07876.1 Biofilm growth-associated repressor [Flavimaricola marinus]